MEKLKKKAVSLEAFVCLIILIGSCVSVARIMGPVNMINTIMGTAHDLLLNTVFFIMGVAVLAGALSEILSEFGVISLINKLLYFHSFSLFKTCYTDFQEHQLLQLLLHIYQITLQF